MVVDSLRNSARMRAAATAIAAAEFRKLLAVKACHLRQAAQGRLASLGLPVRIGDEADRDIKRQVGRHAGKAQRIEGQPAL
jgi:hypothetical protein